jgi:hypothetical protein
MSQRNAFLLSAIFTAVLLVSVTLIRQHMLAS